MPSNIDQRTEAQSGINTFPNPVNKILNVESDSKILSVSIYNFIGVKVYSVYPKASKVLINTSALTNGLFVIEALTETQRISKNILIQHN